MANALCNSKQSGARDTLTSAVDAPTIGNGKACVGTRYALTTFGLLP